jgi:HAMP domain-containing protein
LRRKLFIGFSLLFTVTFIATFYWFYAFSTERALASIVSDMQQTVLGAAAGVDATLLAELFAEGERNEAGGSDHPNFSALMEYLADVQRIEPQAWPYVYVPGSEPNQYFALADLWLPIDSDKSFGFLDSGYSTGFLSGGFRELTVNVPRDRRCNAYRAAEGSGAWAWLRGESQRLLCSVLRRVGYTDAYGSWVSAYAPVMAADGSVAGAVGLDFEMVYVDETQNAVLRSTGFAFLITIPTLLVLVVAAAGIFARPIQRLTAAAARVGEGDYDVDFGPLKQQRFRDEIGVLTEVFEAMTAKVRGREAALKRTVMELRVEIDEAKRVQQVQEIVDTDFFRDLQAKASQMRQRRGRAGAAEAGEGSAAGDGPASEVEPS